MGVMGVSWGMIGPTGEGKIEGVGSGTAGGGTVAVEDRGLEVVEESSVEIGVEGRVLVVKSMVVGGTEGGLLEGWEKEVVMEVVTEEGKLSSNI
jgi:hypothetical protein